MKLPGYVINFTLAILVLGAAAARFATTNDLSTPYFKGPSAIVYRSAMEVADGHSLREPTQKATWPDALAPASEGTTGVEYLVGYGYKATRFFSEIDGRSFARRLTIWAAALLAIVAYAFGRTLWHCQAGGLLAAFLVGFFPPIIDATNGTTLTHGTWACFAGAFQALALLRLNRTMAARWFFAWIAATVALLSFWEYAPYVLAGLVVLVALHPLFDRRAAVTASVSAAIAALAVTAMMPNYVSARMFAAWPVALIVTAAAATALAGRIRSFPRRAAVIAGATMILTVLLAPLRAGASASYPAVEMFLARLRHPWLPPADPTALSDAVRALWTGDTAPATPHMAITFLVPFALIAVAALLAWRRELRGETKRLVVVIVFALAGAIIYLGDRQAAVLATLLMLPLAACVGRAISRDQVRAVLVAIAVMVVLTAVVFPSGAINPTYRIARAAGVAHRDPYRFLWVSMENTDLELVRFVSKGTSVKDPILARPDISALLLTFTGRTSVVVPGAQSRASAERTVRWMRALYDTPGALYRACSEAGVQWVLYSIDMVLDTSRFSPRAVAGRVPGEDTAAWRMHFEPERLDHFALTYENEHYRLFRVTDEPEPYFVTDHPPVYQLDVFKNAGGNIGAFRDLTVDLLLTFNDALRSSIRGDIDDALKKLKWCVAQAPNFTAARIEIAKAIAQKGDFETAKRVLDKVIAYAPDNPEALYQMAYVLSNLDKPEEAKSYLKILYSSTRDPEYVDRARLLEAFIDQGIRVAP